MVRCRCSIRVRISMRREFSALSYHSHFRVYPYTQRKGDFYNDNFRYYPLYATPSFCLNERDAQTGFVVRMSSRAREIKRTAMFTFEVYRTNNQEGRAGFSSLPLDLHAGTDALPTLPAPPGLSPFEFTKKKRWADLLITDLSEAIILILSTQCQVLYCSAGVKEILGWRDEDLIDVPARRAVTDRHNTGAHAQRGGFHSSSAYHRCVPLANDHENSKRTFEQIITDNSNVQSYISIRAKHEVPSRRPLLAPPKLLQGQQRCCSKSSGIPT